jgi:hypothetical protein
MKSIEIIVPRNLIKKFYPHPEGYGDGDYVVDLINNMYTDVFYREEGHFVTITNNKDLISFLKKNQSLPRTYFIRNGVFSLRSLEDYDLEQIHEWKLVSPIKILMNIPTTNNLPSTFMICFYWIEVGKCTIDTVDHSNLMTIEIYEKELIRMIDLGALLDWILKIM